ncbi:hypothetical protein [Microcoleus sp. CAWBG640]|uniref:hypothetical protein n=1 Tax=Microcoleus sp. CAWBG640 TaxID=2841653 RepID=UPI00312B2E47
MTNSQDVTRHLERTVQEGGTPSDQQLMFDPTTGQLVVKRPSERAPSPDAVVASQIAEDGFFRG